MAKKSTDTMIDIPAQLGISQKKRKYKLPRKSVWVLACIALVIIGICGIIYMWRASPDKGQEADIEGCIKQYMTAGKPAAVMELEYSGGYESNYSYNILVDGDIQRVELTTYCGNFRLRDIWYMASSGNNLIQPEGAAGNVILENDVDAGFKEGHRYVLMIYERDKYLSDFYEMEDGWTLFERDSCFYVDKPENGYIERTDTGYLLPDGSLVSQEKFKDSMENVLRILQ